MAFEQRFGIACMSFRRRLFVFVTKKVRAFQMFLQLQYVSFLKASFD
jgi:hypothetical protein